MVNFWRILQTLNVKYKYESRQYFRPVKRMSSLITSLSTFNNYFNYLISEFRSVNIEHTLSIIHVDFLNASNIY